MTTETSSHIAPHTYLYANIRAFYQTYPNWNAVRTVLTWTHHRQLLRVENAAAREWYSKEAIEQGWGSRALDSDRALIEANKSGSKGIHEH